MSELDLTTPFALVRAKWNRYCDALEATQYEDEEVACEECGDPECDGDHTQQDYGWSRGRHTERDRTRIHDRRSRW